MPVSLPRRFVGHCARFFPCGLAALTLLSLLCLAGCDRKKPAAEAPSPVEVTVLTAKATTAPMAVDGIGHVYAVRTVSVRSQVTGVIKKTLVGEGDVVKEGQSLLVIDPAPYKAQLDQATSTLGRDKATAEQSKRDWLRYKDLVAQGVVSQDDYEQKRTTYQQALEQVRVDEAAVVSAQVNLAYCYIASPSSGVVSLQSYKTGNLVEANKDIIFTVNQIQPINVQFAVAERYLPDIRDYASKGKTLAVTASTPSHPEKTAKGKLTVINNTVDVNSGTITLQGEFPNQDLLLWPGQFVNASVVLADTTDTILLPSSALVTTQDGASVFIAKADNTVEVRPVTVGRKIGPDTVVEKGVAAGEKVITSGQIKLFPGVPIKIVEPAAYKDGPVSPTAVADRDKKPAEPSKAGQGN
ncbi:efflux transporter, RND family, MFP subunit [Solidesulfovibrio carbinoliphilus subsp. oakridgensis]|uniref:Efflux transporter, RND family, MFP subunit n=1 Tax=Solidesulfovibrio carbinoliphilus subsp. oakridgensis TaxID=694327 RepID=G7Q691_9BACT|nr:efflux RND transporter periplasmic adaptor subunit [Solidesulfovibrio carbinoliphilus]EHJ47264.1 efflux transporter, RND family, MFP subunit [Solidesulfovibrio carbinoliphilus subsp. oakridgensis]